MTNTNTREIKFRAWDADARIMREAIDLSAPSSTYQWLGKEDLPIMQYTGLEDKNGKQIWEGDIVKMVLDPVVPQYAICEVKWQHEYGCLNFSKVRLENISNPSSGWSLSTHKGWEIIGNIYENPELLNHD